MKNGYLILSNKKENICGICKDLTWLNFIDLGMSKKKLSYYQMIQRQKIYKMNFYQDNLDLQNGEKKEVKWDRKAKINKMI